MENKKEIFPFIRYLILGLIIWNFPGFTLVYVNGILSSLLSYTSYALILIYVLLNGKTGNCKEMLLFGALYFLISILVSQAYIKDLYSFYVSVIKYFIIVWGGYEVVKRTSLKELWFFLFIGSLSILGNISLFPNPIADHGRYSGFYLDANNGSLICLFGLALSFSMVKSLSLFSKLTFTLMGLLTLSRTFMIIWLLYNLISLKLDIKNIKLLAIGFLTLILLVTFNDFLPVKNPRLEEIGALINGDSVRKSSALDEDSREETWARYYDDLMEKPFFGNGYQSFLGYGVVNSQWGVHNTYLLIWGESGIIPLAIFLLFLYKLTKFSLKSFKSSPHFLFIILSLSLFFMTNHNFMTNEYAFFVLMWVHSGLNERPNKEEFPKSRFSLIA